MQLKILTVFILYSTPVQTGYRKPYVIQGHKDIEYKDTIVFLVDRWVVLTVRLKI